MQFEIYKYNSCEILLCSPSMFEENRGCRSRRKIKRYYFHRKFVVDLFHSELFTVFVARATNFHFRSGQPNRRRVISPENNSKSRPRQFPDTNKYFGDTVRSVDKWHLSSAARHLENAPTLHADQEDLGHEI